MGVALRRLKGVDSVQIKLNEGLALVQLKSGNHVSLEEMLKAIEDHGFTPGKAQIRFTGKINFRDGKAWIEVTHIKEDLHLQLKSDSLVTENMIQEEAGKTLTLEGTVEEPAKRLEGAGLRVIELRLCEC